MKTRFLTVRSFAGSFLIALTFLSINTWSVTASEQNGEAFSFIAAGDMRNFTGPAPAGKRFFDGECEAIQKVGAGDFMISPGDCDPPAPIRADIDQYIGSNYLWYPVTGNHDVETTNTIEWFQQWADRGIPGLVRHGPKGSHDSIYSFDHGNSHFIVLNYYFMAKGQGDISEAMLKWMQEDLAATQKPLIWVTGHKPIKSMPDMDSGRVRHNDPLSKNAARLDRFMQLLQQYHVKGYICGHTHDASVTKLDNGVWQADSGHARGGGDPGAPSTFLKFRVDGEKVAVDIYRADVNGVEYRLRKTVDLK